MHFLFFFVFLRAALVGTNSNATTGTAKTFWLSFFLFFGKKIACQSGKTHKKENPDKKMVTGDLDKVSKELVAILQKIASATSIAIFVTSGFRTKEENEDAGGAINSAHLRGLAVDIRTKNFAEQMLIFLAAYILGVRRFGFYATHIHIDIDESLPTPRTWYAPTLPRLTRLAAERLQRITTKQ